MTETLVRSRGLLGGRYELQDVIGQGTFGRVFRGYDRRLARSVAVKVIKPWWTEDPRWTERFEREAQLMAAINHPGIVQIYDIGSSEHGVYYVAELVHGESLADRLARGPLDPATAVDVAEQLCRALAHAHAQRVVHRDVKPGNVLLTRDGRVKVADFGVARLAEGTSDGTIVGTPRYMAPEQARGRTPMPSTDVYGAGVVLYEMLAGRPPFLERSAVELALRHIADLPPSLPAGVPPSVSAIVERALAKEPSDRYPDAGVMADALGQARLALDDPSDSRPVVEAPYDRDTRRPAQPPQTARTRVAPRRTPRRNVNPAEARRYRLLLACVLLLLGGLVAGALLTAGGSVRVPALRGLERAAAGATLHRLDLQSRFSRRYAAAPAGVVIAQRPAPRARVSAGSAVAVIVSAGPPPVRLPQLVGQRAQDAQAILSRLGLGAAVNQVPAPGVTPGLVVQQSPSVASVAAHATVKLSVAETPRWRALTSLAGHAGGRSVPFRIRGSRWRVAYDMGYDGTCTLIFFCSGPSAQVTNVAGGGSIGHFDLGEGSGQTQIFDSGPGVYQITVTPGSDSAHWAIRVQDDY